MQQRVYTSHLTYKLLRFNTRVQSVSLFENEKQPKKTRENKEKITLRRFSTSFYATMNKLLNSPFCSIYSTHTSARKF